MHYPKEDDGEHYTACLLIKGLRDIEPRILYPKEESGSHCLLILDLKPHSAGLKNGSTIMSGASAMNYPVTFFVRAIRKLWDEISTDGVLDAQKMRKIMFGNHDDSVKEIGLEATINRDFIEDSPCHPEVYVPKVMGTAPIYVKEKTGRYIRSCGEGKGPNSISDWLEFHIAKQILENDKSYKHLGSYYIPKYDNSLPIYGEYSGRIVFATQAEKLKFIEDVKLGKQVWR